MQPENALIFEECSNTGHYAYIRGLGPQKLIEKTLIMTQNTINDSNIKAVLASLVKSNRQFQFWDIARLQKLR